MTNSPTYYVPENIGDVQLSPLLKPLYQKYSTSLAWKKVEAKKKAGGRFVAADPSPLNRHDFLPRRGYNRPRVITTDHHTSSAIKSCLLSVMMGKNNHKAEIEKFGLDAIAFSVREKLDDMKRSRFEPTLQDVIAAMVDLEMVGNVWLISNYDELICRLATTGPVVLTYQWYEHFLSSATIFTRAERPWGSPLGLTSGLISGYSANGMLLTIEHYDNWPATNFKVLEEDFVSLLNEGGEVFALDPIKLDADNLPLVYGGI